MARNFGNIGFTFSGDSSKFLREVQKISSGFDRIEKRIEGVHKTARRYDLTKLILGVFVAWKIKEIAEDIDHLGRSLEGLHKEGKEAYMALEGAVFRFAQKTAQGFDKVEKARERLRWEFLIDRAEDAVAVLGELYEAGGGVIGRLGVIEQSFNRLIHGLKEFYEIGYSTTIEFYLLGLHIHKTKQRLDELLGTTIKTKQALKLPTDFIEDTIRATTELWRLGIQMGLTRHLTTEWSKSFIAAAGAVGVYTGNIREAVSHVKEFYERILELTDRFRRFMVGLEDFPNEMNKLVEAFILGGKSIKEAFEFLTLPPVAQIRVLGQLIARYKELGNVNLPLALRGFYQLKDVLPSLSEVLGFMWNRMGNINQALSEAGGHMGDVNSIIDEAIKKYLGLTASQEKHYKILRDELEMQVWVKLYRDTYVKTLQEMGVQLRASKEALMGMAESSNILARAITQLNRVLMTFREFGLRGLLAQLGKPGQWISVAYEIFQSIWPILVIFTWLRGRVGFGWLGLKFGGRRGGGDIGESLISGLGAGIGTAIGAGMVTGRGYIGAMQQLGYEVTTTAVAMRVMGEATSKATGAIRGVGVSAGILGGLFSRGVGIIRGLFGRLVGLFRGIGSLLTGGWRLLTGIAGGIPGWLAGVMISGVAALTIGLWRRYKQDVDIQKRYMYTGMGLIQQVGQILIDRTEAVNVKGVGMGEELKKAVEAAQQAQVKELQTIREVATNMFKEISYISTSTDALSWALKGVKQVTEGLEEATREELRKRGLFIGEKEWEEFKKAMRYFELDPKQIVDYVMRSLGIYITKEQYPKIYETITAMAIKEIMSKIEGMHLWQALVVMYRMLASYPEYWKMLKQQLLDFGVINKNQIFSLEEINNTISDLGESLDPEAWFKKAMKEVENLQKRTMGDLNKMVGGVEEELGGVFNTSLQRFCGQTTAVQKRQYELLKMWEKRQEKAQMPETLERKLENLPGGQKEEQAPMINIRHEKEHRLEPVGVSLITTRQVSDTIQRNLKNVQQQLAVIYQAISELNKVVPVVNINVRDDRLYRAFEIHQTKTVIKKEGIGIG